MARLLAFAVLAVLVAVASAGKPSRYSDDQLDVLNSRMATCVKPVPAFSDFDRPSDECRFEGIDALTTRGVKKEALTAVVVGCLRRHKVDAGVILTAEKCLKKAMDKAL